MSLASDIVKNLQGFSKAMYSTWFYYRPARLLFDVGEGVSTTLSNYVFGVEKIFISHGHYDHIGGLPGFILSRRNARGDTEKGLEIYHPVGNDSIETIKAYITGLCGTIPFDIRWHPIDESSGPIPLSSGSGDQFIRPFKTRHTGQHLSLGYRIVERRKHLRSPFRDLDQKEIVKLIRTEGKEAIMESYEKNLLVYSGDAMPVESAAVEDAEVLMHDATFLNAEDRNEPIHATVREAIESARAAGVKALILFHISHRYDPRSINRKVRHLCTEYDPAFPVYCIFPNRPYLIQSLAPGEFEKQRPGKPAGKAGTGKK